MASDSSWPAEAAPSFRAALAGGSLGEAEQAVSAAGGEVVARLDLSQLADPLAADLLVVEAEDAGEAALLAALPLLDRAVDTVPVVATVALEQLDLLDGLLLDGRIQLLCRPTLADRVAALAVAARRRGSHVVREDGEDAAFRAEVGRIAEVIARLIRRDPGNGAAERRQTFAAEPPTGAEADFRIDAAAVRGTIRVRRMRDAFFGPDLFADPAWDMLLDLFAAGLEDAQVSVSSLCIAAAVPPTTALRWIGILSDRRLIERRPDPQDRRRAFLVLTAAAEVAMRGYLAAVRRAGLTLA